MSWSSNRSGRSSGSAAKAEAVALLIEWTQQNERPAWQPVVAGREPSTLGQSKFGGAVELVAGEAAPTCKECGRELQLFVQLDLARLPGHEGSGVLQLLYCAGSFFGPSEQHDECWAEGGYEAFNTDVALCRVVAADQLEATEHTGPIPPKTITSWVQFKDRPHPNDHERCGLTADYDRETKQITYRGPNFTIEHIDGLEDRLNEEICRVTAGDKLGGWPFWIQGAEYPNCSRCGQQMTLLFQLDSEDNIPYMFGDSGCGHITQCAEHPDVVSFSWACS